MKILKRILLGLVIIIVIVGIGGFTLIRHLSNRAIPDYNQNISLSGLTAPVEVFRDSFAVPHVYAENEHDLYLAVGYLLAEDRLWQMDMLRRVTEGRLSEIFGADYIQTDLLLRALRFKDKSEKILAEMDSSSLQILTAFAEGINQYIENNGKRLPPEFSILRYRPEPWKPYHTLNMIGYMAWDLKSGWSEILLSEISKVVDSARYHQILPNLLRVQPTVFPQDKTGTFSSLLPDMMLYTAGLEELGADILNASNNWAVSGSKSSTGKPLLANDMHLSLSIPGIWYQMHEVVPGKINVTGLVLPGAPAVICGHNDSIAWGMTNTYVDNLDFYQERVNPHDSTLYWYNGAWRKFEYRKEIIKISDGTQVEKTLQFSHRGPVVSGFRNFRNAVVTMHWVGDEMSNEFKSIIQLNRASNWDQFREALKTFTSLSQNIAYADVQGNIGLFCAAGIPVRNREISIGILPGDTNLFDWKGYVPFEELPQMYNPVTGFVASANNRTAPVDYPYHIGTWYSLPYRYTRITEMLSEKNNLSVDDFKQIQLDQHSKLAERYLPIMLESLKAYEDFNEVERNSLDVLQKWNYNMALNNNAALIFESTYLQLFHCIFEDELGSRLFGNFNGITSISRNALDQMMSQRMSDWFDNKNTAQETETLDNMVVCAFKATIAKLQSELGNDLSTWQWGNMHHLVLAHPLSKVKVLDQVFHLNRGPFPVGGSFHTVSPYSYSANQPFDSDHGSSHRHIYDISNWDNSITIIPTGNSGIPSSRHYCDQTEMYLKGQYHADYFSRESIVENALYKMEFRIQ